MCDELSNLLISIQEELEEFKSQNLNFYKERIKAINTANTINDLLDIAKQMVEELEEFDSQNVRKYIQKLSDIKRRENYIESIGN